MAGGEIYLKLECLQRTGSFKVRGAYYTISKLKNDIKTQGCVTASAGNHAQGVAYASSSLGVQATIVMPEFSSSAKIQASLGYGAEIILYGRTYDEAVRRALEICEDRNSIFIHSFDDPRVIAGQGTIGLEMMKDMPDLDTIIVPIGGGGLIAGVAVAIKNINPNVKIYGVQASGAPSMSNSLQEGGIIELSTVDTIADGIAVKRPSPLTYKITKELVDDIVLVDDEEIVKAIFMMLERSKQVVEPAGAAGLAAVLSGKINVTERKVGVIISGGNIDMPLLARIIERSLYQEKRFVKISGNLPDRPGALKDVLTVIANVRANVITIEHDRVSPHINPGKAYVTITVEVSDIRYAEELKKALDNAGYHLKMT
jgi:threonine dehydratase